MKLFIMPYEFLLVFYIFDRVKLIKKFLKTDYRMDRAKRNV